MVRASCLLFYALFFIVYCARAQENNSPDGFGIEANFFTGKVLKHEAKFTLPLPKLSDGVDINFLQKTYGKKEWQQRRRYPVIGIGITYTNYGIYSIYGRCFSIYPNILLPLISGKNLEWTLRLGDGMGYVTKDFSRTAPVDTINTAIGSKLNDYFSLMTDIRYHINAHWDVQAGANFSHISDASFHQPNLGVNLYGEHIGLIYFPATSSPKHIVHDLRPLKNRWLFQFRTSIAFDQTVAAGGPLYPTYVAAAYVSRRWISKNKVYGGVDYEYHEGIYALLKNNPGNVPAGTEAAHSYRSAVFAGNEFLLGRLGVIFQLGYYTHQANQVLGVIYEKLGGNLYLVKKEQGPVKELFLCAYLKTHAIIAEFAEFGLGVGF